MGQIKNIKLHIVTDIKILISVGNPSSEAIVATMSKSIPPELKKYMDRKLSLKLNGNRGVTGILRGFDPFMNLVMDDCVEVVQGNAQQQNHIGMLLYEETVCYLWKHWRGCDIYGDSGGGRGHMDKEVEISRLKSENHVYIRTKGILWDIRCIM